MNDPWECVDMHLEFYILKTDAVAMVGFYILKADAVAMVGFSLAEFVWKTL